MDKDRILRNTIFKDADREFTEETEKVGESGGESGKGGITEPEEWEVL